MNPFAEVEAAAGRSGELYGAPDFLDRDKQLDIALEHISTLHEEIARLTRSATAATDAAREAIEAARQLTTEGGAAGRRRRRRSVVARWRAGSLSLTGLVRTLLWVQLKSHRVDREARLRALEQRLPDVSSGLSGDAPVRQLIARGAYDQAHVLARALLRRHEGNLRFVSLVRELQIKRGSISATLALTRRIEKLERKSTYAPRKIEGRLREVSGWIPRLPGPVTPVTPVDGRTVLHLVKESRPYHSNGFTSRSHRNFLAEQAAGLRPVVLTELGFPRRDGVDEFDRVEVVDGIEHHRLDQGPRVVADGAVDTWLLDFAHAALDVVRTVRPAVIHASSGRRGYETALVAAALAEKTGLPFVYEVRSFFESTWTADSRWEETGETFLRRLAVEQMCMDKADVVITLGAAMRDELVARGADPAKIRLVPNGVDLADFTPMKRPRDLAAELGIDDRPTFGYVSNLDHHRESQETLVEATAELVRRGHDVRCVLVGGGQRITNIEERAEQLGVRDHVVVTGPVDHADVARYYALIDVFVVPRADERAARYVTPLKPFEAMALAKPLVVSDLPALREVAAPPERGLTFPPEDAMALASVLEALLHDPSGARALGRRGRAWVEAERQWSMNGRRYLDIFEEVAHARASGRGRA
ncbi:glycosyltransferase family 4 protein [Cellulomonas sp.]|uniref:glycosyltransferase family 4 protein n=1 Tax=Cellulomonas sp. TaxID=40001 RepID=UPI0028111A0C|nr:glycosyltransferase family 4 protein [Cellulomonas sp.]